MQAYMYKEGGGQGKKRQPLIYKLRNIRNGVISFKISFELNYSATVHIHNNNKNIV